MRGIDGQPMPKSFYEIRGLEEAITDGTTLTFEPKPRSLSHLDVDGRAAEMLAADLNGPAQREAAIKTVLAAAARPFMDAMQTPNGLHELRTSPAFRPSRFDGNAWLKYASRAAWSFGAIRWVHAKAIATMVANLVIAAERARIGQGAKLPMHPAFGQIIGIARVPDWDSLLRGAAAKSTETLGTTMIAPTSDGTEFRICDWTPQQTVQSIIQENENERSFRGFGMRKEYEVHSDEMTAKLKRSAIASTQDLFDLVLPAEYQALLAYEGLYNCINGAPRSGSGAVRYGSHAEGANAKQWSTLLNRLIAKMPSGVSFLPPAK